MTRIVFISSEKEEKGNVPYCTSISTIRVYVVRDDTKFNLLQETIRANMLEELATKFDFIELEQLIESISHIWGSVEEA